MSRSSKATVAVLYGGISAEREVSLSSGQQVISALRDAGYEVRPIEVTAGTMGNLHNFHSRSTTHASTRAHASTRVKCVRCGVDARRAARHDAGCFSCSNDRQCNTTHHPHHDFFAVGAAFPSRTLPPHSCGLGAVLP